MYTTLQPIFPFQRKDEIYHNEVQNVLFNPESLLFEMGYSFSEDVNFIMKVENWNNEKLTNLILDCVFATVEIKVCSIL